MKRYVKEYANDVIHGYEVCIKQFDGNADFPTDKVKERIAKIKDVVRNCSRGLITNHEAVAVIAEMEVESR